ncbi:murein hydrolase activator EnvC family protein [Marinobacterium arenosum]|uniref:murein hydrolase activator EnvC family protein n=1 Tax=Marinobacterium arenosum TaxID=2862496 RepID=UPI001C981B0A|nr:peptidoglycan DD-metalloendopeptidase family protein [Marinobacterium arenosum]MBY4678913.1 peptidoglycan DD-metalloendopeptidase family protein [Marinobacterium arenosum]
MMPALTLSWRRSPLPACLLALLCLLLLLPGASAQAAQPKASEAQLKKLKQQISSVQQRIRRNQGQARELTAALRDSEQAIGRISQQISQLDSQLSELTSNAKGLEQKRDQLKADLASRAERIRAQIRQQHMLGRQPRLELLLNLGDPEQLARHMRYYDSVNKALAQQMQQFRDQLASLNQTETALDETGQAMVDKRRALGLEANKLGRAQADRKKTLATLNTQIRSDQKRLTQLKADQKQMEQLLAELQRSLELASLNSNDKAFTELRGKLPWPLKGRLKRGFGSESHGITYDGIWIEGKNGSAVKAVHSGRVVFSDWLRGYGMVLIIDHGSGYMSLYGYNQSLLRSPGDWVSAGETIATVGQSGGHATPGLYFAIRHKGKATNPHRWLAKR